MSARTSTKASASSFRLSLFLQDGMNSRPSRQIPHLLQSRRPKLPPRMRQLRLRQRRQRQPQPLRVRPLRIQQRPKRRLPQQPKSLSQLRKRLLRPRKQPQQQKRSLLPQKSRQLLPLSLPRRRSSTITMPPSTRSEAPMQAIPRREAPSSICLTQVRSAI